VDSKNAWLGDATYSPCKRYRYDLARIFFDGDVNRQVSFVMLNPSTATECVSDPTVRRCEGYARRWGFGTLVVLNIFALRSTDPKALYRTPDPVGQDNDIAIRKHAEKSQLVVCAWGVHGVHMGRGAEVMKILAPYKPHYLKLNSDGMPAHPLYLKGDLRPKPYPV
jgi:hypothetical protein